MEAMRATIRTEIEALEALFDRLNDQFFGGELERPIITVAPGIRVKGGINYGWCTSWRAWHDGDEADCDEADGYYEINISAETLQRPVLDTVDTMTHEMVHLFNLLMGVKDTSRAGTYHNRRFKEAAEAHGLVVTDSEKYGWNDTAPGPELTAFAELVVEQGDLDLLLSRTHRPVLDSKPARKPFKYLCPRCGAKFDARRPVMAMCLCGGAHLKDEEPAVAFACIYNPDMEE